MGFTKQTALAVLTFLSSTYAQTSQSGSGTTTRYWDCCKPSCAWPGKGQLAGVVQTCDVNDKPLSDDNVQSGCNGGGAYMCSDQSPWAVSDSLAYGFAAVTASAPNCCQCYQLTFTSGPIQGKKMIVQATNTGTDVNGAQFDLAIPGGGFGMFDGCTVEWGATDAVWGQRYGGPTTNTCPQFPSALQPGCGFRWGWMKGADNPTVNYETVACPAEIVAKSGCGVAGASTATTSKPTEEQKPADTTENTTPSNNQQSSQSNTASNPPPQQEQQQGNTNPAPVVDPAFDGSNGIPVVDQGKATAKSGAKAGPIDVGAGNGAGVSPSASVSGTVPSGTATPSGAAGKKKGKGKGKGKHRYHPRPQKQHTDVKKYNAVAAGAKKEDCEEGK